MATTRDYIEYFASQVDIAPATSQEELQAAHAIQQLMEEHGVDARIQEFDVPSWGGLQYRALMILLFLGIFLAGLQGTPVAIAGILVTVACFALFLARYLGVDLIGDIGPSARSQNVVAVHRADGPLADKSNRPIVVVAHYDTPRDNFLHLPQMASFRPLIGRFAPVLVLATGVCALVQLLVFLPDVVRRVVWIAGILAALPLLMLGIASVYERLSACTDGANDNKASVAALLGVLSTIRPGVDAADGLADGAGRAAGEEAAVSEEAVTESYVERYEEVVGVRHGKETLEELHILPEGCEVVYVAPGIVRQIVAQPVAAADAGDDVLAAEASDEHASRAATAVSSVTERGRALFSRLGNRLSRGTGGEGEDSEASAASASSDEADKAAVATPAVSAATVESDRSHVAEGVRFSVESDASGSDRAVRDDTGLATLGDVYDPSAPRVVEQAPRPARVSDPTWGTSNLAPEGDRSFARRAVLFDLPDPSSNTNDPFATNPRRTPTPQANNAPAAADESPEVETTAPLNMPTAPAPVHVTGEMPLLRPLDDGWKGGATNRSGLRVVDESDEDDDHEELRESLREAVLGMDDEALVAHDVWFVALGASTRGHAGMRAFLDEYRSQIRGAFVVNLSCVGAGTRTLFTREGIDNPRRADRRMERLLTTVADDLHLTLEQGVLDWDTTDATVAMRRSVRAMTIAGVSEAGTFALSRTPDDVAENLDASAVVEVSDLVCEMIRRS